MLKNASCRSVHAKQWAEQEFGEARLGDRRLSERLLRLAACFLLQPTASIPKACGAWSQTKAAYRFFSHPDVNSDDLIEPHLQQTAVRMAAERRVLVIQDTTGLNYGERAGLGLVGSGPDGAKGLWLHTSMAFTPAGQSLGLVQVQHWRRDPEDFGKAARCQSRAIVEKESHRWVKSFERCVALAKQMPGTELINVADREGDIYELFHGATAHPEVGVLVRARHNRRTTSGLLFDELVEGCPVAGTLAVRVPRRPGKKARTATLELSYHAVTINRPRTKRDPLRLWVIDAREPNRGRDGLHWRLLTNRPVEDPTAAQEYIGMYAVRWQIEEYHRVLKSGCQTEARQLESAEPLLKVLMIDLVVAWRVLQLNRLARSSPDSPAAAHFGAQELQVLRASTRQPAASGWTLRQAVRAVAQLGGFLARASDGEPGAMTLWRGLEVLACMLQGWELAQSYG
jgi:hypothetical protein